MLLRCAVHNSSLSTSFRFFWRQPNCNKPPWIQAISKGPISLEPPNLTLYISNHCYKQTDTESHFCQLNLSLATFKSSETEGQSLPEGGGWMEAHLTFCLKALNKDMFVKAAFLDSLLNQMWINGRSVPFILSTISPKKKKKDLLKAFESGFSKCWTRAAPGWGSSGSYHCLSIVKHAFMTQRPNLEFISKIIWSWPDEQQKQI